MRYADGVPMKTLPPSPRPRRAAARAAHHFTRRRHATPPPPPLPATPFHAFIAYADIPAAGRAMGAINQVLKAASHKYALKPMLWRNDQLTGAKWRERAMIDAGTANVVVFASSSPGELPPELDAWISEFISRQRDRSSTIVAILGDEEAWTISIEGPSAKSASNRLARAANVEALVA